MTLLVQTRKQYSIFRQLFSFVLLFLCFVSCIGNSHAQSTTSLLIVGNQGNFSDANGTITAFDLESGEVTQDFAPGLNTLVQSVTVIGDNVYVVGNSTDWIDIVDVVSGQRSGQILGITSPRYMTVVDENKAYVSNLFDSTVTIVDFESRAVMGTIAVGSNPEDIELFEDRAYVANSGFGADSTLTVLDVETDTVIETLSLSCDGPRFLEIDAENELWVFCKGNTVYNDSFTEIIEQTKGTVVVLDTETNQQVQLISLDAQAGAASFGQDAWHDVTTGRMFLIQGQEVLVFDTASNTQVDTIQIPGDEELGGVAFDPVERQLYIARITGFTSTGFVSIHDETGQEVNRFSAGIAPGSLAFYRPVESNVSTELSDRIAEGFTLGEIYPNPVASIGRVTITVNRGERLTLQIFDMLGQRVGTYLDNEVAPGRHLMDLDVSNLPAGLYVYRLSSGERVEVKTFTVLR